MTFIIVIFNCDNAMAEGFDPKAVVAIEYAWKSVLGAGGFYTLVKVITSKRHADGTISRPEKDEK